MITGRTRLFVILADPIQQVRTPEVFNAAFAERGLDSVLVPLHVAAGDLGPAMAGLRGVRNLGGMVLTVPHKQAVLEHVDEVGSQARLVGAANVVRRGAEGRLSAEMFDGKGFVAGLKAEGHDPARRRVLQVGAGGAGSAIAFALADAGVEELAIFNRTRAKAEALAARVREAYPAVPILVAEAPDPRGYDIAVNATSMGMKPDDPAPLDFSGLGPGMVAAEIIMKPPETAFVQAARAAGASAHLGRHMLDNQIALMAAYMGAF